jgi:hypothetical protein
MSKFFLATLSLLVAFGCAYGARSGDMRQDGGGGGATPPSARPSGDVVLDFKVIEQGTQSRLTKDTELSFSDPVTYERWYESHSHERKAPAINFDKEMAVVVVLPRNTGGFAVNLDRVIATADGVRVVYTEVRPTKNMMTIQALTQPYFIATVPKQPGKVVFEHHIRAK